MMIIGPNIRRLRKQRGWTILDLSTRAEMDSGYLSKLERGIAGYGQEVVSKLAKALGVPAFELFTESSNVEAAVIGTRRVPLLDYVQAGQWTDVIETRSDSDISEYMLTTLELSGRAFAMRIQGDSMLPQFEEGDIVVVDPVVPPRPGDYVVASNGSGQGIFKKYRIRGLNETGNEVFELVPLNPDYPTLRSDLTHLRIVGTMMEHRKYRKR